MKYMLLICGDEATVEHITDGCGSWSDEMQRRGVLQGGARLRPPTDATTVQVQDDAILLFDGPFAEAKVQVGGFCLIECVDLDEAIEITSKHPAATYGTIEIRPLNNS